MFDNTVRTEVWYVRDNGCGIDHSQIIQPLEGQFLPYLDERPHTIHARHGQDQTGSQIDTLREMQRELDAHIFRDLGMSPQVFADEQRVVDLSSYSEQELAEAIHGFTDTWLRQEGIFNRIMPAVPISEEEAASLEVNRNRLFVNEQTIADMQRWGVDHIEISCDLDEPVLPEPRKRNTRRIELPGFST